MNAADKNVLLDGITDAFHLFHSPNLNATKACFKRTTSTNQNASDSNILPTDSEFLYMHTAGFPLQEFYCGALPRQNKPHLQN